MSQDKVYIGNGREKAGKYGSFIALTLFAPDVEKINEAAASGKPVTININQRKQPSPKGFTHYGVLDTWEPPQQRPDETEVTEKVKAAFADEPDDVPF